MAYSGILDDVRTCINLGIPKRVPVFAITGEFDVKICGITHTEYARDANAMVKCQTEAVKRFDYDWVFLIPDDYMPFEPLGVKTKGTRNIPLTASEYLPAGWETLKKLKLPNPRKDGRMPAFLEALRRIKNELGDTICLTGNIAAPFTSVALLYGVRETLTLIFDNPELLRETAEFFVELQIEWGKAQIETGADAIWLGDCVSSSSFIAPKHYTEFAVEGAKRVSDALKEAGAFVFYHAGEKSIDHLELMADLQPSALSIGEGVDIKEVKETVGKRICILGNIDGIKVLERGSPKEIEMETARIMETGRKNGGYIFNSGEAIPYQTPEENIRTMMQTAREHGLYHLGF